MDKTTTPFSTTTKMCITCKQEKTISEFHKCKTNRDGHETRCRACTSVRNKKYNSEHRERNIEQGKRWRAANLDRAKETAQKWRISHREYIKERSKREYDANRDRHLRKIYNISLDEYNKLSDEQGGICAVCGGVETYRTRGRINALSVDHSHTSNKNRGLLCGQCNTGLGNFRDNPELLSAAADYLDKWATIHEEA